MGMTAADQHKLADLPGGICGHARMFRVAGDSRNANLTREMELSLRAVPV